VGLECGRATTAEEIAAVQRLRYAVYVEEMGRYPDADGADEGRFAEPEDENSWLFYARDGDLVVAATRMTWGGDGFSARQIEQYQLEPFLTEIPPEMMGVGERNTVLPAYRGTGALDELLNVSGPVSIEHDIRIVFGCCEPHLVSLYLKMGQRTYAPHNINSPAAGYLIPLVSFVPDADALRGVGAASVGELPSCVATVLARSGSVRTQMLTEPDAYLSEVRRALDEVEVRQISMFDGLSSDEVQRCLARSTIIKCAAGDRVLKRGGTARNMFVVLDGTLEVRDDDGTIVNVLSRGDAFGEMAFLLERPRSFHVDAVTDDTRILSLSEGALRTMIGDDAPMAAKLLLNLAKVLCVKLIRSS